MILAIPKREVGSKIDNPVSDKREKNPFCKFSSYQDFTSKQTLISVSPLSFKNINP